MKPGETFERYSIEAEIGSGGMGTVYRAHDARLGRRVALKVIAAGSVSGDANARLLREARAAAALDHPNAVSIFDVGEHEGAPYIVMELVPGRTLRSEVGGSSGVPMRIGWVTDVARVLSAAHKRGLVHRDVKPENVMLRDDGVIKVLDFGIARRTGGNVDPTAPTHVPALATITVEGVNLGTPVYMAPEQIRGEELDGRADQFAWGVTAFELLTGKLPWRGANDALAVLASVLTDEPDADALDRAGVAPHVKAVVLRALRKRPADRFATMDDVVRALEGESIAESAPSKRSEPAPRKAGVTAAAKYTSAEVRQILSLAIERQESARADDRLGFDDLVAAAREVGVEESVLRDATRDLRDESTARKTAAEENAEYDVWLSRRKRALKRHFGIFVIVMGVLQLIGLLTGAFPWTLIPALGWLVGVAIHALTVGTIDREDWVEEQNRRNRRETRRQRRRAVVDRAIEEGAAALLREGEAMRQRVRVSASAPRAEGPRVRVAVDAAARDGEQRTATEKLASEEVESVRAGRERAR